jgi:hypothetical protein
MSVTIEWLTRGSLLYVQFSRPMTLDDIRECVRIGEAMIRAEGRSPVHFIVDTRDIDYIPRDTMEIRALLQETPRLEQVGFIAIVTPSSPILRLAALMVAQMGLGSRLQLRLFTSHQAALEHIHRLEARLAHA